MRSNKLIVLGLIMVISVGLLSGCGSDTPIIGGLIGLESDQVFQVDQIICSDAEYKIVLMDTQNTYKQGLGLVTDWSVEVEEGVTLEDFIKEKVKEDITVKYTLAAMATEKGITLTPEEQAAVISAASTYYSGLSDAEKEYLGAEQTDVEMVYTNYLLANKVYEQVTEPVGSTITDEEARVIKIQYIKLSTNNYKETKINKIFQDVVSLVNGGYQEFSREAKQYSENTEYEKIIKKNEASAVYEVEAFNLSDNEFSNVIQDGTDYYLVYCVDSYMEDESLTNKNSIIDKEKKAYFNEQYSQYLEEAKTDFNTKAWNKIELSTDVNVVNTSLMTEFNKIIEE